MTFTEGAYRAFADFEKSAWVQMSSKYDSIAGQMTRQAVDPILAAVEALPQSTLLDIATGPGYVAAAAAAKGVKTIGVDFSAEMLADARRTFPDLVLEQGDAESLQYADASFDKAVCAFGMLHFPRPGRALAEAHRVVRPGGKVAYTIWATPTKEHLFGKIREIVLAHADLGVLTLPGGPGAFMLSDPLVSTALMDAAGFVDVRVEDVPCHFVVRSSRDVLGFLESCSPRILPLFQAQTAEIRTRIEQELIDVGNAAMATGRIQCPILLVVGTKVGPA